MFVIVCLSGYNSATSARAGETKSTTLPNPILFVTQVPIITDTFNYNICIRESYGAYKIMRQRRRPLHSLHRRHAEKSHCRGGIRNLRLAGRERYCRTGTVDVLGRIEGALQYGRRIPASQNDPDTILLADL